MKIKKSQYRHNFPKKFFFKNRVTVGLLGGSFDPAHHGHIHISNIAIKRLKLNQIWWLVSPQNRLKNLKIRTTFRKRIEYAKEITSNFKKIRILDLEYNNRLYSSNISLKFLKKRTRNAKLIWIMGSDNLLNFQNWLKPKEISKIFPVAVIERPSYSYTAINSIGAHVLGKRLLKTKKTIFNLKCKSWIFVRDQLNYISSSEIRNNNTFSNNATIK